MAGKRQSLELETLDQLLCGPMFVTVIRSLYDDGQHFVRAINAMLQIGQLRLLANGEEVPHYRWREVLSFSDDQCGAVNLCLEVTEFGARRVT